MATGWTGWVAHHELQRQHLAALHHPGGSPAQQPCRQRVPQPARRHHGLRQRRRVHHRHLGLQLRVQRLQQSAPRLLVLLRGRRRRRRVASVGVGVAVGRRHGVEALLQLEDRLELAALGGGRGVGEPPQQRGAPAARRAQPLQHRPRECGGQRQHGGGGQALQHGLRGVCGPGGQPLGAGRRGAAGPGQLGEQRQQALDGGGVGGAAVIGGRRGGEKLQGALLQRVQQRVAGPARGGGGKPT